MPVLLVRHGWAGERGSWPGDDEQRPLDERGVRQAEALVALLASLRPARVLSSPARRCIDTVRPLAEALGLNVEECDALGERRASEALGLVRTLGARDTVALCSHGDVIPAVLDALACEGMVGWDGERCEKGSVWVVSGGDRPEARYLAPPV